jgi:arylsulfatase A-like enzyme
METVRSSRSAIGQLADHPSIGEILRKHDYFSARVGKIYHMGNSRRHRSAGEPGGDEPASWDWTYNVLAPETFQPRQARIGSQTPTRTHFRLQFRAGHRAERTRGHARPT